MPVTRSLSIRRVVVAVLLLVFVPLGAIAQIINAKPPRRLPPNASETSRIPAGVDTGSPATSDSVQLGTPVPPNASGDRSELKTRSAAARAAARPKATASGADCTNRVADGAHSSDGKATPVALPKSGSPANSTPPSSATKSTTGRAPGRLDC
jgi:hypothetical protein